MNLPPSSGKPFGYGVREASGETRQSPTQTVSHALPTLGSADTAAETLVERSRRLLQREASLEFRISRAALEVLVTDSERYAELNQRVSAAIPVAQSLRQDGLRITGESYTIRETCERVWKLVSFILNDDQRQLNTSHRPEGGS